MQLSLTQYAAKIGLTRQGVHAQIEEGRLKSGVTAKMIGNSYLITVSKRANNEIEEEKKRKAA